MMTIDEGDVGCTAAAAAAVAAVVQQKPLLTVDFVRKLCDLMSLACACVSLEWRTQVNGHASALMPPLAGRPLYLGLRPVP